MLRRINADAVAVVGLLVSCVLAAALPIAEAADTDSPKLDFERAVGAAQSMPRLHSLLVSYRGELVFEKYFNGHGRADVANVKSVSKSIISALVGIAIDEGYIAGVDQTIDAYFPALASEPDKARITIGDLLSMQAGLETTSNRNYGAWVLSDDWIEFALDQPLQARPGERMQYSTGNTHLLSAILTQATGRSTLEFARDVLGEPLGFQLAAWPRDPTGIYFGGNDMELTPRQMLAFGELYMKDGNVNGRQVVPAQWVEASLQRRAVSPRGEDRYYGYGWWIREMAGFDAPYAWGFGGQFIVLVPDIDLVIVTTSSSTPDADRRLHTRRIYDFVEYDVIAPVAETLLGQGVSTAWAQVESSRARPEQ
jgi:CubicO group peptidase (beta-lactamase class C family)